MPSPIWLYGKLNPPPPRLADLAIVNSGGGGKYASNRRVFVFLNCIQISKSVRVYIVLREQITTILHGSRRPHLLCATQDRMRVYLHTFE